jgi:hypothetical protein
MRAVLLNYLIKSEANKSIKIKPSTFLKKCGVRIDGSVWVIPEQAIPWEYLNEHLVGPGIQWWTHRFDESESGKIKKLARDGIAAEAERIQKSLEASLEKASARLAEVEATEATNVIRDEDDLTPVERAKCEHNRFVRATLRLARKHLEAAQQASLAFDIVADVADLTNAVGKAIAAETEAWLAWRVQSGLETTATPALAVAS